MNIKGGGGAAGVCGERTQEVRVEKLNSAITEESTDETNIELWAVAV